MIGTYANAEVSSSVSAADFVQIKNPDLRTRKNADNTNPAQGEYVNYFVTLTNKGYYAASGVVMTDNLPLGLCYQT